MKRILIGSAPVFTTALILVMLAFYQCYRTTSDLIWTCDMDFDRDMAFIHGILHGNFGQDPNYLGEYLWYNPLLTLIEAGLVLLTKVPSNIFVTRAGAWLNVLGPLTFMLMMVLLFDKKTALAALLSFLFLSTGNMLGWGSATYSPWLYPVCFAQFIFYLNIVFCYVAFTSQQFKWFFMLGVSLGFSFLGHTGPTVIIIFMLLFLQIPRLIQELRSKNQRQLWILIKQGALVFIPFIAVSLPMLYYIIGKYHLDIVNRITVEHLEGPFLPVNFLDLLRENFTVTLLVAAFGFMWFYRKATDSILRKILFYWLISCIFLFIYTTIIPTVQNQFGILLPGIVPSFHFFFYLKALESVFFGIGMIVLFEYLVTKLKGMFKWSFAGKKADHTLLFCCIIIIIAVLYFPVYAKRDDFTFLRNKVLSKESNTDAIQVYSYIIQNMPDTTVILCEIDNSIFPVMATGRKMVAIYSTFSNPYISFEKRESDRNNMLSYLAAGKPESARELFETYSVDALLIENRTLKNLQNSHVLFPQPVYQNEKFSIFNRYKPT